MSLPRPEDPIPRMMFRFFLTFESTEFARRIHRRATPTGGGTNCTGQNLTTRWFSKKNDKGSTKSHSYPRGVVAGNHLGHCRDRAVRRPARQRIRSTTRAIEKESEVSHHLSPTGPVNLVSDDDVATPHDTHESINQLFISGFESGELGPVLDKPLLSSSSTPIPSVPSLPSSAVPLVPSLSAPTSSVPLVPSLSAPTSSAPPVVVFTSSTDPPSTVHNVEAVSEAEATGVHVPVSEVPLTETSAVEVPMTAGIASGDAPSSSSIVPLIASQVETSSIDTPIVGNQPTSVGDAVPVEPADDPSSIISSQ
ncbi:PREDICTED: flocculation protein FLO11-like [Nicotiana attenuata]|uniref:flocculation protein FLO11-like n=1 Tax=Nicotiana attenuata TaxID=49451 RepID=UPI0009055459|nr:PREDICTED: flocculation protein FLO11-like [Nicotiana attenuata]